ncbi:hypothetical protein K466DRAFT_359404 [Polyporus arcularius HHB13444]|uniref:Uncharacterized protein n=1 Tax=Polyporus arcularius HHB13444 TaxID=1314778 RepID=A0A5C3NUI2_9APHY|nr:hypothetical protein K466DRAFT_359404 [Polyporus arcularius HHB13444]
MDRASRRRRPYSRRVHKYSGTSSARTRHVHTFKSLPLSPPAIISARWLTARESRAPDVFRVRSESSRLCLYAYAYGTPSLDAAHVEIDHPRPSHSLSNVVQVVPWLFDLLDTGIWQSDMRYYMDH